MSIFGIGKKKRHSVKNPKTGKFISSASLKAHKSAGGILKKQREEERQLTKMAKKTRKNVAKAALIESEARVKRARTKRANPYFPQQKSSKRGRSGSGIRWI